MNCSELPVCAIQGAAIDRILGEIVHNSDVKAPIDYVLCIGHFLPKVCNLTHAINYYHLVKNANDDFYSLIISQRYIY